MSEHERRYEIVLSHSPDVVERVVAERMSEGWRPIGGVTYGHDGGGCVWAQAMVKTLPPEEQRDEHEEQKMRITSEHHIWKTVYDDDYFTRRVTSGYDPRWFGTNSGAPVEDMLAEALEEAFQEERDE